jgi:hypothetical protein
MKINVYVVVIRHTYWGTVAGSCGRAWNLGVSQKAGNDFSNNATISFSYRAEIRGFRLTSRYALQQQLPWFGCV